VFFDRFEASDSNSFALKKRVRVPVIVRESGRQGASPDLSAAQPFINLLQTFEDVVTLQQCFALMTDERIQVSSILMAAREGGFLGSDTGTQNQTISLNWRPDSGLIFGASRCVDLRRIWRILHGDALLGDKALGLALRRLSFATQRTMPEDRLLDVFIAAEAFYRKEADERRDRGGSTGLRVAERAATWSEGTLPGWSRDEVFQQMRSGYRARNAVAHGDGPKADNLKVMGKQASLDEVVRATEGIVRSGLYKAIQQLPETQG